MNIIPELLEKPCRYCKGEMTYCQLTDKNGNKHVWLWCEPCYKVRCTVPKVNRPPWIIVDQLPVYIPLNQRQCSNAPKAKKTPHTPILENPLQRVVDEYRRLLRSLPYEMYLKTEHWKNKRDEAIRHADGRCQLCNAKHKLNVHHRTYDNLGNEPTSDLTVLCRQCHAKFHNVLP